MNVRKLIILMICALGIVSAGDLQPYLNYGSYEGSVDEVSETVTDRLIESGMVILGSYTPANDESRRVIVITSSDLLSATAKGDDLAGFAGAIRVGITLQDGQTIVSSQNPAYWANAYFRDDYSKVSDDIDKFSSALLSALSLEGGEVGSFYGSTKDFSEKDLRKYHYMFGMEYFDDVVTLGSFESFESAVSTIEANLETSEIATLVFQTEVPGKNIRLYGIALGGDSGESRFVSIIDIGTIKHTPFLPYEILVMDGKVVMMHGRFRIALSFPDLTMATFSKIITTPGAIADMMGTLTK